LELAVFLTYPSYCRLDPANVYIHVIFSLSVAGTLYCLLSHLSMYFMSYLQLFSLGCCTFMFTFVSQVQQESICCCSDTSAGSCAL